MAENTITFEVFTLPHTGSFVQKFPLTQWVTDYEFTHEYGVGSGDGVLQIDPTFPKFRQIIYTDPLNRANDVGSIIRVSKNGIPYRHYVAARLPENISSESGPVPLTLRSMNFFLDKWRVGPYDHDAALADSANPNPSRDPDWIYGGESALTFGQSISNEIQQIWRSTGMSSGTFTITDGVHSTSAMAWNVAASEIRTRLIADIASINDVLVVGDGTALFPWEIEFTDPKGDVPYALAIGTNATNGVFSTDVLRNGGTLDPSPWTQSIHPVTKRVHGNYQVFDIVDNTIAPVAAFPAGDTHVLRIDADSGSYLTDFPGCQQLVSVTGGTQWRGEIKVFAPTTARTFRLVIRDMQEYEIASIDVFAPADTLTTLSLPVINIPIGVDQVIFRVGILHITNIQAVYVAIQSAQFAQGFPPAPWGEIVNDLNPQINLRTSMNTWVTRTWTDTLDSSAVAWDRDLSWLINHRQSQQQLCEISNEWGYESTGIYWSTTNSRFEWGCYNLSNGGTDLTATGFKIGMGDALTFGEKVSKLPATTASWAFGTNMAWGRATDATMVSRWGVLEEMSLDRQGQGEMVDLAAQMIETSNLESATQKIRVHNLRITPGVDFDSGDFINIDLGPAGLKGAFRVAGIVEGKSEDGEEYADIHIGALVKSPATAQADAVRTLWRKMELLDTTRKSAVIDPSGYVGGGDGGTGYITIAASDAPQTWKDIADYQCDGVDDWPQFRAAFDQAWNESSSWTGRMGIWLSPGYFKILSQGVGDPFQGGLEVIGELRGCGVQNTYVGTHILGETGFSTPREDATLFWVNGNSSHIHSFTIEDWFSSPIQIGGIRVYAEDVLIDHMYISTAGHGVWATNPNDLTIRNCRFYGGGWGPQGTSATDIQDTAAIFIDGVAARCQIVNNRIERWYGDFAIKFASTGFSQWTDLNVVSGNIIEDQVGGGIYIGSTGGTLWGYVIANNIVDGWESWGGPEIHHGAIVGRNLLGLVINGNIVNNGWGDGGPAYSLVNCGQEDAGVVVSNNVAGRCSVGIRATTTSGGLAWNTLIIGNSISEVDIGSAIYVHDGLDISVISNVVSGSYGTDADIWVHNCQRVQISGNQVNDGWNSPSVIRCQGLGDFVVSNNLLTRVHGHGIHIDNCTAGVVSDNMYNPKTYAVSHNGIVVDGTSINVALRDNTLIPDTDGVDSLIGIQIGASCTGIIAVGNDLRPLADWATDAIVDAGTGTILTYPAHGTYGDNFT